MVSAGAPRRQRALTRCHRCVPRPGAVGHPSGGCWAPRVCWRGRGAEPGPRLAQPRLCPPRPQAQAAAPEQLLVCEARGLEEGVSSASPAALGKPFSSSSSSCPAPSQSRDIWGLGRQCPGVALTPPVLPETLLWPSSRSDPALPWLLPAGPCPCGSLPWSHNRSHPGPAQEPNPGEVPPR